MNRFLMTFALSGLLVAGCATQPAPMPQAAPVETAAVEPAPAAPVSFRATPPQPGAPRAYEFPDVTRATLSNGMRVLIAENHTAPLVIVRAVVRSGASHDPADHAGLASITADMLDEGAGKWNAIQIAESVGNLGARLDTGADWDSSYVGLDVLSRNLAGGMDIFAEVLRNPTFPSKEFDRIRKERLTTIVQQKDQAPVIAGDRFAGFVYGGTPYANPLIGTRNSLEKTKRADVQSFYRRHYLPNNVSLIITGDVTPAEARALAEKKFGSWKRGSEVPEMAVTPPAMAGSRIFVVDRPQAVQSEIRLGHVGVPRNTEDYFRLLTMNSILGGVFGSRINLNLRERHGYTYGARSSFAFRRQAGPFIVSAPVRNEVTLESVQEIMSELRRIRSGDLTDSELNDARNYLMGVFPATVQSASALALRIQEMELYGLPEDYFESYRDRIARLSKDDITTAANRYVNPDQVAIVVVGKASEIKDMLSNLNIPMGLYDLEGNPIQ